MMDSPVRGFLVGEFETRLERLHKLMSTKRLYAMLLISYPKPRPTAGSLIRKIPPTPFVEISLCNLSQITSKSPI